DLQLFVVALVEIMLAGKQRVPAAVARVAHHDELVLERAHHVGVEGVLVGDEDADFHAASGVQLRRRRASRSSRASPSKSVAPMTICERSTLSKVLTLNTA